MEMRNDYKEENLSTEELSNQIKKIKSGLITGEIPKEEAQIKILRLMEKIVGLVENSQEKQEKNLDNHSKKATYFMIITEIMVLITMFWNYISIDKRITILESNFFNIFTEKNNTENISLENDAYYYEDDYVRVYTPSK